MTTKLDRWMNRKGYETPWLVTLLGCDRTQAWRIRHGRSGTTKKRAQKLEKATGIPWHEFIEPERNAA